MKRTAGIIAAALLMVGSVALPPAASAASTATYSATQTIPVPPASTYAGGGGGDGWGVAMTPTAVYNIFHHSGSLTIACHLQSDASACWNPETISDASGNGFATPAQPGLWINQATGKLYTFATRTDMTGGVVCIDTTQAATNPNPFCGFTALTSAAEAPINGMSGLSAPAIVGTRMYSFNYVQNASVTGTQNKLLCFDLTTFAACGSQPYTLTTGAGTDLIQDGNYPSPAVATIGGHVIVPLRLSAADELACYDPATGGNCAGSWPVQLGGVGAYDSSYGAPYPMLEGAGVTTGLCLPTGTDPCYSLAGTSVATPTGMTSAISATSGWNGAAFTLGPRVYVPNGNRDAVECYDYGTSASCVGFPKAMANLGLLYTVNSDPQRPTCVWVNSDNGSGQIQNFDAYTGGACGQGPIRVLASSFVVPTQLCQPATYSSLQVTAPAPGTYTSGTVAFQDGDAAPIPGQANGTLDGTGTVNLSGRNLSTAAGLPQFLITLAGAQGTPGAVTVKLVWTGTDDPACMAPGTTTSGGHTAGAGACGDTVFIAATGSGQYWKSDTDLSVSPQLTTLYKGIVSKAGHKKVGIRVLNYPATSVDALFAGVNQISERNKITYAKKVTAKLQSNINDYLAGEKQGLAAMWGAYTSVRFSCSPSTKIVLGGYSQGSMVVHEFLNELAATKDKAGKQAVIGAVLLADPERVKYSTVLEMSDAQFGSNGVCDMFSKVVHCAAPDTLSDIAGFYQRTAISVCAFKDPVCDTSDLLSDLTAAVVNTGARKSIINLAMLTHDSYYWLRATTIAGKILGNRVARG